MNDLSEASLLHTLRVRFRQDNVYTFVGPILISINPYSWANAVRYSDENIELYHNQSSMSEGNAPPPHLFACANQAYLRLVRPSDSAATGPCNQSIIISGESGSGKTEATKIIMQFLSSVSQQSCRKGEASAGDAAANLEERVLRANPLLESFGNAKTLRNDNSSRFGKFIALQFDSSGRIAGATITNYLLERTRVVRPLQNERNYHILYQLLAAAVPDAYPAAAGGADSAGDSDSVAFRASLQLLKPSAFEYLAQSQCYELPEQSDAKEFTQTMQCMHTIGLPVEEQRHVLRMLALVLHLGNMQFAADGSEDDGCAAERTAGAEGTAADPPSLCAQLLQVTDTELQTALCKKLLVVSGNTIVRAQKAEVAADKRDALAKALYEVMFSWLIARLNGTISQTGRAWGYIGILDIYGFEAFETNSFEQLCINYANEKLQRHFNRHIFEVEQQEYQAEGIDWTRIAFNDNQPCVDLIEGKPGGRPGVLQALDDVWNIVGMEDPGEKFLNSLHQNFGPDCGYENAARELARKAAPASDDEDDDEENQSPGGQKKAAKTRSYAHAAGAKLSRGDTGHPCYTKPKFHSNEQFGVVHYAGEVLYSVAGFSEKNSESLNSDLKTLLLSTQCPWMKSVVGSSASMATAGVEAAAAAATASPAAGKVRRRSSVGGSKAVAGGGRTLKEKSVGSQFKGQLTQLMDQLALTSPAFIRCIKSNQFKKPLTMDPEMCLQQLKYSGMIETVSQPPNHYMPPPPCPPLAAAAAAAAAAAHMMQCALPVQRRVRFPLSPPRSHHVLTASRCASGSKASRCASGTCASSPASACSCPA
jgi:myosin heavy subunit